MSFFITRFFPENALENSTVNDIKNDWLIISLAIFIGPLFETLIFQELTISSVRALITRPRYNFCISIIISALLFSLIHLYSVYYMIYTFFFGIILALAYYISIYRKQNAFLTLFLIHVIWNSIVFVVDKVA